MMLVPRSGFGAAKGLLSGQRRHRSTIGSGYGKSNHLTYRRRGSGLHHIGDMLQGPASAGRTAMNFHEYAKRNQRYHMKGVPRLFEVFNERMRPEKDLPHGDKFFSKKSGDLDDYFPTVENPYDDGRDYRMTISARVVDLTPFLMHEVDDRIDEVTIRRCVQAVAQQAESIEDFLANSREWGWLERVEALSSRLIVHHIKLLATVIASQHNYRAYRREATYDKGILRTASGDRFYAIPDQPECYN